MLLDSMGLEFEHGMAGIAHFSAGGPLKAGLGLSDDSLFHLAGSYCWGGTDIRELEQQGHLERLSLYLCCFPTCSTQHCNFKVAGLFIRWLRIPKLHAERERDRERDGQREELRKLESFI